MHACCPSAVHCPPASTPCECILPLRLRPAGDVVPMGVKEGDKVLLPDYGGTTVKLEDKE